MRINIVDRLNKSQRIESVLGFVFTNLKMQVKTARAASVARKSHHFAALYLNLVFFGVNLLFIYFNFLEGQNYILFFILKTIFLTFATTNF